MSVSKAILIAAVLGHGCSSKDRATCDDRVEARRTWITTASIDSGGETPAALHMSATGRCADDLRVETKDCSRARVADRYGTKAYTATAQRLGFRTLSCGSSTYEMSEMTGEPQPEAPPPRREPVTNPAASAELEALRKAMCDCADRACAEEVDVRMKAWIARHAGPPSGVDAETQKQVVFVSRSYADCMIRATRR